jgi:peptide/nickel transport system substrate-binding protein
MRTRPLLIAAALTATLALTACAGATSAGTQAVGARVNGGTIVYAHQQEPACVFGGWIEQAYLSYQVIDNLTSLDANHKVVPWLATGWKPSADGLSWTFTLKKGVTFTDGTPLTAGVVAYNFDYWLQGGNSTADVWLAGYYKDAVAIDDRTVRIDLLHPYPDLPTHLTQSYFGIQSQHALETRTKEQNCDAPIGSGAFTVQKWNRGQDIILKRNPHYTSPPANAKHTGPAYVDEIDWKFVPDGTTRVAALQSGQVQALYDVPAVQWKTLKSSGYQLEKYVTPGRPQQISFNTAKGVFTDERVRQAFAYSLDRQKIVDTIGRGVIPFEGNGPVSRATPGYSEKAASTYSYDPKKADALLDAALRRRLDHRRRRRLDPAGGQGVRRQGGLRRRPDPGAAERVLRRQVPDGRRSRPQRRLLDRRDRRDHVHQLATEHPRQPQLQQQRVLRRRHARGVHRGRQLGVRPGQAGRRLRAGAEVHRRQGAVDRRLRPAQHPRRLAEAARRVAGARAGRTDLL